VVVLHSGFIGGLATILATVVWSIMGNNEDSSEVTVGVYGFSKAPAEIRRSAEFPKYLGRFWRSGGAASRALQ
jgi:hypothetical protein